MRFLCRILTDERGLESVEYAVFAGLIVAALVAIIAAIGELSLSRLRTLGRFLYGS